jgi:hypothetical protein
VSMTIEAIFPMELTPHGFTENQAYIFYCRY